MIKEGKHRQVLLVFFGFLKKILSLAGFKNIARKILYIFLLFIIIILLRVFVFEFYTVEGISMESTLFGGDIILVNKLKFGARLPMQPKHVPFLELIAYLTNSHSLLKTDWKYHRVPGIGSLKRGDVMVFEHPQKADYIIKRCTGLPGDTFVINHNHLYVNNILQNEPLTARYSFNVKTKMSLLPEDTLLHYGLNKNRHLWRHNNSFHMSLTHKEALSLEKCSLIDSVFIDDFPKGSKGPSLFPTNRLRFTCENYGPFIIPSKNKAIKLNKYNILFYRDVIVKHEKNTLRIIKDDFFINDLKTDSYTFKQDYFFMMGDNRYQSRDSRYWGFVSETSIIGTTGFIFFSMDKYRNGIKKIRVKRIFKKIKNLV